MTDQNWAVRGILVFVAMGMIVFAARRHQAHWALRFSVAALALVYFSYAPWVSMWSDFHKSHPAIEWPHYVVRPWFHATLAGTALLALVWGSLPIWRFRHRLFSSWRMMLGEEVWVDKDAAIKLIRSSQWGRLRAPSTSVIDALMYGGTGKDWLGAPDKNGIKFRRFLELSLNKYEQSNPAFTKMSDGAKLYLEKGLLTFLENAFDADVLTQFGSLP